MQQNNLEDRLAEMRAQFGGETAATDDEHARWVLYQKAMASPGGWSLLQRALETEPDPAVALSVVLHMLERLPARERESWVRALRSADKREYAQRRAEELQILESILHGRELDSVDWSVWLQRKLAEQASDVGILERLAQHGETKRVRRMAAERLRCLP